LTGKFNQDDCGGRISGSGGNVAIRGKIIVQ